MSKEQTPAVPGYPHPSPQVYPQVYPNAYPQALPGQFSDNAFAQQQPPPSYSQHYPQQQQQLQQQPQVVHTTIVLQNPVVGPDSTMVTCPSCRATVTTTVVHEAGSKTHWMALSLCLIGCWPCCLIPYCTDSCLNANHTCPNCNAFVGSFKN
ncbi:unnamed protein product [Diamesa tonsa]